MTNTATAAPATRAPKTGWAILAVVFLAGVCAPANMAKVTTLAPILMEVFDIGAGLIGWVIALFYVLGFCMAFPAAGIINRFGIKTTVVMSLIVGLIGNLIGVFSPSLPLFMVSRVLEGMGMGVMGVVGVAAISPWFAPSRQGLPLGIWGMWVSVPMFVGPIIYTAIYDAVGAWQPVWWFTIGLTILALIAFLIVYRDPDFTYDENENVVELAVAEGEAFERPSIKAALKLPVVWVLAFIILLDNIGFMGVQGFLTTYVYDFLGAPLATAAALVAAAAIIGAVMSPVSGAISDKIHSRRAVLLAAYVCALIYTWFVFSTTSMVIYVPVIILMGVACGTAGAMQWAACGEAVPNAALAGAMAVLAFMQNLGMFLGSGFFGSVVEAMGGDWSLATHAFIVPMYVVVVIILLVGWKKLP